MKEKRDGMCRRLIILCGRVFLKGATVQYNILAVFAKFCTKNWDIIVRNILQVLYSCANL